MLLTKIVSSLENCFVDSKFDDFKALEKLTVFKNERFSFQFICVCDNLRDPMRRVMVPKIEGELAKYVTVREVRSVPATMPCVPGIEDDNYLRKTPGIYPDILNPLQYDGSVYHLVNELKSLWIEIDLRKVTDAPIGKSTLKIGYYAGEHHYSTSEIEIEILDVALPEQELILTQWFHCDSLAHYYRCPVWSEEHWAIVEKFAKTAVSNGINLLLTPVFTPPLDTRIGGERLTTQLVEVTKNGDEYTFGYDLLDRWIEMCNRVGIKYFEIAHFFTQWGANHAPKVMATVDGEYKRIFGWETDAQSEEYVTFLRAFVKDFLAHMKARGDDKRCFFHISDEPSKDHIPSYKAAKESVADLLEDYTIMDALSSYDFYKEGVVKTPIPSNDHIKPFIEGKVPNLWTYYCSSQSKDVSNRLIAMPLYRNRSIGMQMYKYDIVGFLQWGFNFYGTHNSYRAIDPYSDSCGYDWVPSGDTYSVYPAADGSAIESMRIVVFYDALQDIRAMKLAESLCGKEAVIASIEKAFGKEITFDTCARSADEILNVRNAVIELIKSKI